MYHYDNFIISPIPLFTPNTELWGFNANFGHQEFSFHPHRSIVSLVWQHFDVNLITISTHIFYNFSLSLQLILSSMWFFKPLYYSVVLHLVPTLPPCCLISWNLLQMLFRHKRCTNFIICWDRFLFWKRRSVERSNSGLYLCWSGRIQLLWKWKNPTLLDDLVWAYWGLEDWVLACWPVVGVKCKGRSRKTWGRMFEVGHGFSWFEAGRNLLRIISWLIQEGSTLVESSRRIWKKPTPGYLLQNLEEHSELS